MISRLLASLLALLFSATLTAQPVEKSGDFEWGPRPENAVFDPDGLIGTQLAKEISTGLADVLKNESIDIMVILLKDLGSAPTEFVAKRFEKAWAKSPFNCVVIFVPGPGSNPILFPSKQVSEYHNPDEIVAVIAETHKRIAAQVGDQDKVKAAAIEAVDMLRYWINTVIITSNTLRHEQEILTYFKDRREKRIRYLVLLCIATFIPSVSAVWILVAYLRRLRPALFPKHSLQTRLGAPYAGGNAAIVRLGSRKH
jgi:hypothetical protein